MIFISKVILIILLISVTYNYCDCEVSTDKLINEKHNQLKRQIEDNEETEEPDGDPDIAALIITGNLGGAQISDQDSRLAAAVIAGNIGAPDFDSDEQVVITSTEVNTQRNDFSDDYYDDANVETNQCSVDSVFDSIDGYFPDDYEESKRLEIKKGVNHLNETVAIIRRLSEYGQNVSEMLKPTMKRVLPRIMESLTTINLPPDCLVDMAKIGQAIQDGHMWAAKFLDSMGGIPTGISQGIASSLGEYEQCLSIQSPEPITPVINGQYCLASFIIPYPPMTEGLDVGPVDDVIIEIMMKNNSTKDQIVGGYISKIIDALNIMKGKTFRHGICLPSSCKPQDVELAINEITFPYLRIPIEIGPQCQTKNNKQTLNSYQIVAFSVFSIILLLMILGTIIDIVPSILVTIKTPKLDLIPSEKNNSSGLVNFLRCFSVIANNRKLFAPARELSAVEGIRFLASINIFLVHQYLLPLFSFAVVKHLFAPYGVFREFWRSWKHLPLRNFPLTDLFFYIGGLMASYIFLIKLEQSNGRFNYIQIIIFRWIRLAVPMIGMILMFFVVPLVGDGPIWNDGMEMIVPVCQKYWYRNLLFTNNIQFTLPMDEFICNPGTWYTSADFQLFLIVPLLIYVLYRFNNYGVLINIFVVLIGCVGSVAPRLIFGIPLYFEWTKWRSVDDTLSTLRHTLYSSYAHLSALTIGIINGYLIRKYNKSQFRFNKWQTGLLWAVLPSITVLSVVWLKDFFEREVEDWELLLWAFSSRVLFVSGFAWISFACATGHGELVNKFLSWHVFIPLSRLSVGIYLLHPIPMVYRNFSYQQLNEITDYKLLTFGTYDFIITILLAYILFLMFDCPTANLMQLLMKKSTPVSYNDKKNQESSETLDAKISETIDTNT